MPGPVLEIGQPAAKWGLALMSSQQRFSTLSPSEPVVCSVRAYQAGALVNPTSGTVQFAFASSPLLPPSTWYAGSWDVNEIGDYVAQCEIGSSGVVALAAGVWWVWVQVTLSPVDVIRQIGSIVME